MWSGRLRCGRALAALLLLSLALPACATRPRGPRAPRETGQLVLWEIQSAANPRGRAYLLGSVHAARPDFVFDPAIDHAYEAADALVIEADITSEAADAFGFLQRTIELASLPEGQTLDQVLPKPTYDRLGEFLRERGQPLELYRRFEPWLLMTMVTSYIFAEAGLPPEGGVDLRLSSRANGKKPILALETPEFQLSLFDSLPIDVQAGMLGEMLEQEDETRALSARLFEAWERGDLDALESETISPARDDPKLRAFYERVYLARNQSMAQRIDALLREEQTYLIVVGAGHVVGEQGIPALLSRSGHRIVRIPKTPAGVPGTPAPEAPAPAPAAPSASAPAPPAPASDGAPPAP
jgi:hypothetical protein